jgi:hypothetical protein
LTTPLEEHDLIRIVSERAGISPEQARTAVNTVMEFAKDKMPLIGDQLKGLLAGGGDNALGNIAGKLGGLLGK